MSTTGSNISIHSPSPIHRPPHTQIKIMSTSLFCFLCQLLLLCISSPALATNFLFNGFKPGNLFTADSALITTNGFLRLTNNSQNLIGHAFFPSPVRMLHNPSTHPTALSFSSTFVFDIVTINSNGGNGLAFVIAPSKDLPGAENGQYLGLLGSNNMGNSSNHLFAIEFDTVQAIGPFKDIDENHVGVDINSLDSVAARTAAYFTDGGKKNVSVDLLSGHPIQAWIDYSEITKTVNVTIVPFGLAKPEKPLISHVVDLSPIFKEQMYVGFSASTGKLSSYHFIIGWSFSTDGVASNLSAAELPLPPSVQVKQSPTIRRGTIVEAALVSSSITIVVVLLVILAIRHQRKQADMSEQLENWELDYPHRFRYKELYKATKGFKETQVLGSGGFGTVYRGTLRHTGEEVAIKKISSNSRQGIREFITEISSLGRMRHRNLVQLHGWCKRKEDLLLVYEFMRNGSLDAYLYGDKEGKGIVLTWAQRLKILKDVANGLVYLHEEWEQVVVHRDIKSSNVLLDAGMKGRLGDFGLARLYEYGENPHTTHVVGTLGYIPPELTYHGKATPSADVFAYGILLLEVACGRRPIDASAASRELVLMNWVRECHAKGKLLEVADRRLEGCYVKEEMEVVLNLGLICSQANPQVRPSMTQVTQFLSGNDSLRNNALHFVFSQQDSVDLDESRLLYTRGSSLRGVTSSVSSLVHGGR